ncbi:MAG: YkgJ family cysteine cluster protein [Phycisphaerae bacterium]
MKKPDPSANADAVWYADGLRFSCTQCGHCCGGGPGYVWVSKAEITAISRYLQMPEESFVQNHTRQVSWRRSLLEQRNWDCEFLVPDSRGRKNCSIYAVRPQQCRTWPFWKSNLDSRDAWDFAAVGCPGMNNGKHHPLPVIQAASLSNGSLPL